MPTIHRESGYRFYFYGQDHAPPHVHVERGGCEAKFLLVPVRLLGNDGFKSRDLAQLNQIMLRMHRKFV